MNLGIIPTLNPLVSASTNPFPIFPVMMDMTTIRAASTRMNGKSRTNSLKREKKKENVDRTIA